MKLTEIVKIGKDILFSKKPAQPVDDDHGYSQMVSAYAEHVLRNGEDENWLSQLRENYSSLYELPVNVVCSDVFCDIADELITLKKYEQAETYFARATTLNPHSTRVEEVHDKLEDIYLGVFFTDKRTTDAMVILS